MQHVEADFYIHPGEVLRESTFCGRFGEKYLAVKNIIVHKGQERSMQDMLKSMIAIPAHENVVQYLTYVFQKSPISCLFLANELCHNVSFEGVVEREDVNDAIRKKICLHITLGLGHIHQFGVKHGDLRPEFIFFSLDGKNIKIGAHGLRELREIAGSLSRAKRGNAGSWGSPEYYSAEPTDDQSDIFTLGLLFHYILTKGQTFNRDKIRNAKNERLNLNDVSPIKKHIIELMVNGEREKRPNADDILRHPLFWSDETMESFTADFSHQISEPENAEYLAILFYHHYICPKFQHRVSCYNDMPESLQSLDLNQYGQAIKPYEERIPHCSAIDEMDFLENSDFLKRINEELIVPGAPIQSRDTITVEKAMNDDQSWVFRGNIARTGGENVEAIVKVIKEEKVFNIFRFVEDCKTSLFVPFASSPVREEWPNDVDVAHMEEPPTPGEDYYWLSMREQVKLFQGNEKVGYSVEYKKKCIIHMLLALNTLRTKGLVHGNINPDKMFLSLNEKYVNILGSNSYERKGHDDESDWQKDSIAMCKVISCFVCNLQFSKIKNIEDFKELKDEIKTQGDSFLDFAKKLLDVDAKTKAAGDTFVDFACKLWNGDYKNCLCHPFLWDPEKCFNFFHEVIEEKYDLSSLQPPTDWIKKLKLQKDEKEKWYEKSDGHIYAKAKAEKSTYKKNKKSEELVRLIVNKYKHLVDDLKKEEKNYTEGQTQTLFLEKQDVWRFFERRFPDFLFRVYGVIDQLPESERKMIGGNFIERCFELHELPASRPSSDISEIGDLSSDMARSSVDDN